MRDANVPPERIYTCVEHVNRSYQAIITQTEKCTYEYSTEDTYKLDISELDASRLHPKEVEQDTFVAAYKK